MRRADRLFQLVQLLRVRRMATGQQLASELCVSTRTVYRDIRDLQTSGVPVRGEAGVGYRLENGYELPPLTFTTGELEGLVLGARIVSAWGDRELASAVRSAMTKIEAVVPKALRQVLLDTALYAPDYHKPRGMAQHLALLRRAIGERRKLGVRYVRADGADSQRVLRPLALYFWGNKWTLAAWCELRGDYRSFRPDRIGEIELLEAVFEPDDAVSLAGFLARADHGEWTDEAEPRGRHSWRRDGVRLDGARSRGHDAPARAH
jgi:predicted DNA-binding transcriptional regulator YafY